MFAYIELDSFLHRRNPMIKLAVIAFVTIWLAGKIPLGNLLRRLMMFLFVSFTFMMSMLILRGFDAEEGIVLTFGILQWTERDLVHSITLGFRILALVTLSMGFVLTTRPRDLVLSLILQCKVPVLHGYEYFTGVKPVIDMGAMQGMCSELTVSPYLSGEMNVSVLCPSTGMLCKWDENDMGVGVPFELFEMITEGVAATKPNY